MTAPSDPRPSDRPEDVEGLAKLFRAKAVSASEAYKMMALAKQERNRAAGDVDATYGWPSPEETSEWKAASTLESLQAQLSLANREIQHLRNAGVALDAQLSTARADALEEVKKVLRQRYNRANECENLGFPDPETGAADCSLENRDGYCICAERLEELAEVEKALRSLADQGSKS